MSGFGIVLVLLYVCGINLVTFLVFWIDKERARAGSYRIAERTLLMLALAGGSPAALLARRRLRHKTRKQPFTALLWAIVLLQACVGAALPFLL